MTRCLQAAAVACATLAAGCGGASVQGRYTPQGEAFFDSLTFGSDDVVEIVFVTGTSQGRYTVDGDRVTITAPNGQQSVLTIDGSCVSHQLLGKYCRDGSTPPPTSASSGSRLSQIYETRTEEGLITLEFGATKRVKFTMKPSGPSEIPDGMSLEVPYDVRGDDIHISLPGNERLELTRAGDDLEGTMNGETVRFVRR